MVRQRVKYFARGSSALRVRPCGKSSRAAAISSRALGSESISTLVFESLALRRARDDGGRTPVPSQQHAIVLAFDPIHDLRKVSLELGERRRFGHDHDYSHCYGDGRDGGCAAISSRNATCSMTEHWIRKGVRAFGIDETTRSPLPAIPSTPPMSPASTDAPRPG